MKHTLARLITATVLGAAVTGCATVQGDPYYEPAPYRVSGQPGYIYNAPPVYSSPQPVYPAYSPPPAVIYYGARDRDRDNRWDHDRNRGDWRERDRAERDRVARERDRDRREQQAREADRRQRDRDQAQREQAERDRRAADDRRNREAPPRMSPGTPMPHPMDWRARQQSNSFDKP